MRESQFLTLAHMYGWFSSLSQLHVKVELILSSEVDDIVVIVSFDMTGNSSFD